MDCGNEVLDLDSHHRIEPSTPVSRSAIALRLTTQGASYPLAKRCAHQTHDSYPLISAGRAPGSI